MKSNNMRAVDHGQMDLGLSVAPKPQPARLSTEIIECQPSMMAATTLGISAAGLDDKEFYLEVGIDAGHWSRITKGKANFNPNLYPRLFDITGNESALYWLAGKRGYDLVPRQSTVEKQLEEKEQENELLKLKLRHMEEFMGMAK